MQKEKLEYNLQELESQLSFPSGENGIEVAKAMNQTNIEMTLASIENLNLIEGATILEIGHGNCAHLNEVFKRVRRISFHGLEISETMKIESERINQSFVKEKDVKFSLYDGDIIPFEADFFDGIMTVNTIYFWKNSLTFLNEIYRVLKPGGRFVLTFAKKEFMEGLDFVGQKFTLYNNEIISELVEKTAFELSEIRNEKDNVNSDLGDLSNRDFSVVVLKK